MRTFNTCFLVILYFVMEAGLASIVFANPPDAGSLLRQQEQLQQKIPKSLPKIKEKKKKAPLQRLPGETVLVERFRFTGEVDTELEASLQELAGHMIGTNVDLEGLKNIAANLTEYLRKKGWILARVFLPQQDVTQGIIQMEILKGRLDGSYDNGGGWRFSFSGDTRIREDYLKGIAENALSSGEEIDGGKLERGVLLINDLPGITAKGRFEPGSTTGTSQMIVNVEEGGLLTGNIGGDNYGSYSTGEYQANGSVALNDPFGFGSRASVSATGSEGLYLLRLNALVPLGYSGLKAALGYTDMTYESVNGSGVIGGLEGRSQIYSTGLSWPVIRRRHVNVNTGISFDYKALKDDSNAGVLKDKRINRVGISASGNLIDKWAGGGLNNWSANLVRGELDLSRVPGNLAADAATLKTDGYYTKFEFSLSRLQRLPKTFTMLSRMSGQWSNQNLDSSEEFILGGPYGIRAYPVGEAQGDMGMSASLELRYDLPFTTPLGSLQLNSFIDAGFIQMHQDKGSVSIGTAEKKNRYDLQGAGLGLTLAKGDRFFVRTGYAWKIGPNPGRTLDGKDADNRDDPGQFWAQGVFKF